MALYQKGRKENSAADLRSRCHGPADFHRFARLGKFAHILSPVPVLPSSGYVPNQRASDLSTRPGGLENHRRYCRGLSLPEREIHSDTDIGNNSTMDTPSSSCRKLWIRGWQGKAIAQCSWPILAFGLGSFTRLRASENFPRTHVLMRSPLPSYTTTHRESQRRSDPPCQGPPPNLSGDNDLD